LFAAKEQEMNDLIANDLLLDLVEVRRDLHRQDRK